MRNLKLIVSYDGTGYLGWQKTKMGKSIEETLEQCIAQILQEKVSLQAASRTDAGVHAGGQIVNFFAKRTDLDVEAFHKSLRSILPRDISLLGVEVADEKFHPTLDCDSKEYHYHVCYGTVQLPFHRAYSWHWHTSLVLEEMQRAAKYLLGTHDFSTFCNEVNLTCKNGICTLSKIEIYSLGDERLCIAIQGNRFLYKMVRNLVGTLVYVGAGKISATDIPTILASKDRTRAGMTAPSHGLTLKKVFYS